MTDEHKGAQSSTEPVVPATPVQTAPATTVAGTATVEVQGKLVGSKTEEVKHVPGQGLGPGEPDLTGVGPTEGRRTVMTSAGELDAVSVEHQKVGGTGVIHIHAPGPTEEEMKNGKNVRPGHPALEKK